MTLEKSRSQVYSPIYKVAILHNQKYEVIVIIFDNLKNTSLVENSSTVINLVEIMLISGPWKTLF